MFIDSAKIELCAGTGGNGVISFRHEKFVDNGGPFGGNGGRGANIILRVDEGLRTLLDFSYNKKYSGKPGENGRTKSQHGKKAQDLVLLVPPGTVVLDDKTGDYICDLISHDEDYIVCHGGRGGRGNAALAKAGRHSLEICENGEPGEERNVRLELKLLADVGLVGFPSVGKSSLISMMSSVKPKIAAYHFTTLVPNLGVAKASDNRSYVIADLPGLIEGAAQGKGLGHQFLKHIERTKIILHVVDMGSEELRDPIEDYQKINHELSSYGFDLEKRTQVVCANKMDLPNAQENLKLFKEKYKNITVIDVSALENKNLEKLKLVLADELDNSEYVFDIFEKPERKLYKFEYHNGIEIFRDEEGYLNVRGYDIDRLVKMTSFTTQDNLRRFTELMRKMGVYELLRENGVNPGESIIIMDYEFEYQE